MRIRHYIYIACVCALLQGCKLFGTYERPTAIDSIASQSTLYRDVATTADDTISFGTTPWREVFTDPLLQELIDSALVNNTNMLSADMVIRQAQIGLKVNKLAFLPTMSFAPQGTMSKAFIDGASNSKTYSFPVSASWQLDFFGKLRNAKKQGELNVLEAKAAKRATQTAIIAAVANMYYSLQMLDAQLETTQATLVLWDKNIQTMEAMMDAGMTTGAGVASAKANYITIQATVPVIEENIHQIENSLCSILHETPHAIKRSAFTADGFPESFRTGIPSLMLTNRPDVAIREYELGKCFYDVNIARGNFCPQFSITGSGSFTNSLGTMIVNPGKFLASGIASLVQPIFQSGKLIAALKVSKIQEEQQELKLQQTILDAGIEVSNALSSYETACMEETLVTQQVEELTKAQEMTWELFQHAGGSTTYLETLSAQMSLLNGQLSLVNHRYSKIQAVISLYQALGGGGE